MYLIEILILLLVLFLSAFFSGSEIALISLSRVKIQQMLQEKRKGSQTIKKIRKNPHKLLINIVIANNIVNIFGASFATAIAIKLFGNYGIGIATGIMTFLILTFGEIIPKTFARKHNEKISLLVAKPIFVTEIILFPLIKLFELFTIGINKKDKDQEKITKEEIKTMIKMGEEEGAIHYVEKEMIHNIFMFNNTEAWEVMTPRTKLLALEINSPLKKIISTIKKVGFSRIPVYKKTIDNIQGTLYVKHLLPYLTKKNPKIKLEKIMRPIFFIPRNKKIGNLLKEFQNKKIHIAIVVDEFGITEGVITLEDLLEEIFGEIYDEYDVIKNPIKKIDKKTFMVDGSTEIDVINKKLKISLPDSDETNTLGGLILEKLEKIPKKGTKIDFKKAKLIISKREKQRIDKIKIIKK